MLELSVWRISIHYDCILSISTIFLLANSCFADVVVKETLTFREVEKVVNEKQLKYGIDEILLVFDIDNTLLTSETDLGGDIWYQWQTGAFPDIQPSKKQKVECLFDVIG